MGINMNRECEPHTITRDSITVQLISRRAGADEGANGVLTQLTTTVSVLITLIDVCSTHNLIRNELKQVS